MNRSFRPTGHGDRRAATTQDEAKVLVLSTPGDSREDALNGGEVLSTQQDERPSGEVREAFATPKNCDAFPTGSRTPEQ